MNELNVVSREVRFVVLYSGETIGIHFKSTVFDRS